MVKFIKKYTEKDFLNLLLIFQTHIYKKTLTDPKMLPFIMGKLLIYIGIILIIVGIILVTGNKINLGKLPGDIVIKRENFTFYFPVMTMVLISVIISLILFIINRLR